MATEAQRLITVSISKIAMSRSNRGGINLHKNLLVASVLHKARTAYMLENIQSRLVKNSQNNSSPGVGTDATPVSHAKPTEHMSVNDCPGKRSGGASEAPRVPSIQPYSASDKENSPPNNNGQDSEPKCSNVSENNGPCTESMDVTISNCSDTKNDFNKRDTNVVTKKCVRCVKRRSSGPLELCSVLPKKPRLDYESENEENESESSDSSENSQTRPQICVESAPQISNLVSIFNTGFAGLCVQDNNTLTSPKQYSGRFENAVLSCANEVKENGLDNSMSSVIALTV